MDLTRKLVRNVPIGLLTSCAGMVVGLFLTRLLLHKLGNDVFGLWMLLGSLTGYIYLFDLGLGPTVVKYVAEARGAGQQERLRELVSTAVLLYLGLALAATVIYLFGVLGLLPRFKIEPELLPHARVVTIILVVACCSSLAGRILQSALHAAQRYDLVSYISLGRVCLTYFLCLLALRAGYGIRAVAAVIVAVALICLAVQYLIGLRIGAWPGFSWRSASWRTAEMLCRYGVMAFAIGLCVQTIWYSDNVVLGAFLPVSVVAYYAIALRINEAFKNLGGQIQNVILPAFAELEGARSQERVRELLLQSTKISAGFAFGLGMVIFVCAQDFITWWVGASYLRAMPALYALLPATLGGLTMGPAGMYLYASGQLRAPLKCAIAESVVNLGLSIFLVIRLRDPLGVALGTTIPHLCLSTAVVIALACRATGVRVSELLANSVLPSAVGAALLALAGQMLCMFFPHPPWVFLPLGLSLAAAYAVGFCTWCLSPAERAVYSAHLAAALYRRRGVGQAPASQP